MKSKIISYIGFALLVLFLIFYGSDFYSGRMDEMPKRIHAWSSSDRYAIALGYERNNLDLFYPEFYAITPENVNKNYKEEGRVGVDLPLPDYLSACIMKITGSTQPYNFRTLTLIFYFTSCILFYLIISYYSSNIFIGLGLMALLMTNPVITYYGIGFIPSVHSFSLFIGFLFCIHRFHVTQKFFYYVIGIFCLLLSALIRMPYILFFGISGLILIIYQIKNKKFELKYYLPFVLCGVLYAGYFFYQIDYIYKFGTIFLRNALPPTSWADLTDTIKISIEHWKGHYFTVPQYIFIIIAIISVFVLTVNNRKKKDQFISLFLLFVLFSFLMYSLYVVMMIHQFPDHDYYLLDNYLLIYVLLLISFALLIKENKNLVKYSSAGILLILAFFSFRENKATQYFRNKTISNDRVGYSYFSFEGSEQLLSELNISDTSRILVMDANTFNIPFILMDRKGFPLMSNNRYNIEKIILESKYDYIVCENQYIASSIIKEYPEIYSKIERVGGNNRLSVFKRNDNETGKSLTSFLNLDKRTPVIHEIIEPGSHNTFFDPNLQFEDSFLNMKSEDMYYLGLTLPLKDLDPSKKEVLIHYVLTRLSDGQSPTFRICLGQSKIPAEAFYYEHNYPLLQDNITKKGDLETVEYIFAVDYQTLPDNSINLFIGNYGKDTQRFKRVEVSVYQ